MVKNTIKLIIEGAFSIKITKIAKKTMVWHVLYIRGYEVTYAECETLLTL